MSSHKFKVGQLVTFFSRESASGLYEVTQLLPPEGDMFQVSDKKYQGTSRFAGPVGFKKAAKGAGEVYDDLNARCDALRDVVWQLAPDE